MPKLLLIASILSFAFVLPATAELSPNPWLIPNDEEDIEDLYEINARKYHNNITDYTPEETTEIDRTAAYIELDDEEEDTEDAGIMDKIKKPFTKKETRLIANTEENRRALQKTQQRQTQRNTNSEGGILDGLGIDKAGQVLNSTLNSTKQIIPNLEKATGVNFKGLAKQMGF